MQKPELTMIEFFSGIGAQKRGIDNTELYNLSVIATSDVDKEAVVEYAAIHHDLTNEMVENYENYPSREEMAKELKSRNIGMDFDKGKMFDWDKLIKKKTKDLEKYWLAMTLQNNLGDISKIEQAPTADCWFYSSPCQCFSLAGKQDGLAATCNACGQKYNPMDYDVEHRYLCPHCGSDDIKGTRSGLLLEVERLLIKAIETNTAPKYLCLENVKNLVGKQFKPDFDAWVKRLEYLGYNTYWKVLNAKECGIPQNRERVFAFSIRKDIDAGKYTFPLPFDTGIRLKDILEKNVDERYYINTERASNLIQQLVDKGQLKGQRECCDSTLNDPNTKEISNAILARYDAGIMNHKSVGLAVAEPQSILVKNQATEYTRTVDAANTLMARDWKGYGNQDMIAIVESETLDSSKRLGGLWDGKTTHQAGSVWDSNGMSPTLDTAQGGGRQPHIVENISETNQNNKSTIKKSIWKDINSHYKISSKGVIVDVVNKCQVKEIEGRVELEVKGKRAKFPIDVLMKKYFSEEIDTTKPICVGNTTPSGKSQWNAVYSTEGVSQTLCAGTHGYATGSILEKKLDKIKNTDKVNIIGDKVKYIESIYRIRKLTVRECFKLMGFEFSDWDKCSALGISNSAGYKAAGNSIVTNCISLLFEHLYQAQYDESYICTDEKMQNFIQPKED